MAYGASALLAGKPAALPLVLPCRVRLTLLAEDDTLLFKCEELERLPDDEHALLAATRAWHEAQRGTGPIYSVDSPPNMALIEQLQARLIK